MGVHLHSRYSPDSITSLEKLVERARELGLERLALTDHDTAEGALELKRREPELTIVGQELHTTEGEVIGLFLDRTLKPYRRAEEILDEIHALGGITYLPHPCDRRRYHFYPQRLVELADRVDVIEVHNQWAAPEANQAAADLARDLGKPASCGSDAHAPPELGHCWLEMEEFAEPGEFLANLPGAQIVIAAPPALRRG